MRSKLSYYFICWIAVGALVEVQCEVSPRCPEGVSGFLAHPWDYHKYLLCENGMTHIMGCQQGAVFNFTTRTCDAPSNVTGHKVRKVRQVSSAGEDIRPDAGYSGDFQQVRRQRCYNVTVSSTPKPQEVVHLGSPISFSALERILGISVSMSGKYGMFSLEEAAKYLRSMQDNDYAISLNYYRYTVRNVTVKNRGFGDNALSTIGKRSYNNGKNPFFGLVCGDYYLSSYQKGALLTMGIYINLGSSHAKQKFKEIAGTEFGDIVSALKSIKIVSEEHNITGSVSLRALQIGGDFNKLTDLVYTNVDSWHCSFGEIKKCIKAARGLLNYAKHNFPTQFSFRDNTGISPLGNAFSQYKSIELLGLTPPVSLVTPEVVQYRHELSSTLKENEYYQQKIYSLLYGGYPVKFDDDFRDNAKSIMSKANSNVNRLMQSHGGAIDCFNKPDECNSIKETIDSDLRNITVSDLKFIENIKYTIPVEGGILYNTGGESPNSWEIITSSPSNGIELFDVNITNTKCAYSILYGPLHRMTYNGSLNSISTGYVGQWCDSSTCVNNHVQERILSPFFFEAYSIMLNGRINDSIG